MNISQQVDHAHTHLSAYAQSYTFSHTCTLLTGLASCKPAGEHSRATAAVSGSEQRAGNESGQRCGHGSTAVGIPPLHPLQEMAYR